MFAILVSCILCFYSVFVYVLIIPFTWARGGTTDAPKFSSQNRWRKLWTRWITVPGIGITLFAVFQWRNTYNKQTDDQQLEVSTISSWEISCYRSVPLRPLSRAWGWISDRQVPIKFRHWVYGKYAKMYEVNLDEVENELVSYNSLAEFFSRRLKDGVRPIDFSQCIVSPADGKILNLGEVTSCQIEQIKGVTYSLQTFLGDLNWKQLPYIQINYLKMKEDLKNNYNNSNSNKKINLNKMEERLPWKEYKNLLLKNPNENELYQFVVYLAPGDYHRFHSPVHWNVRYRRHFQGELLSVNPKIASWVPELFSLNERVIYFGEWEHGFFSMAAVGATNVGSIRVHTDKALHTNSRKWAQGIKYKDKQFNMVWEKGQEVGEFRMGSTIIILFEAPKNYKFNAVPNQRVKVGQSITCPFIWTNDDK